MSKNDNEDSEEEEYICILLVNDWESGFDPMGQVPEDLTNDFIESIKEAYYEVGVSEGIKEENIDVQTYNIDYSHEHLPDWFPDNKVHELYWKKFEERFKEKHPDRHKKWIESNYSRDV